MLCVFESEGAGPCLTVSGVAARLCVCVYIGECVSVSSHLRSVSLLGLY